MQRALNFVEDALKVAQHVVIPEAQNAIAGCFNSLRSRYIGRLLPIVLAAVELDHELCLAAGEIDDEGTDGGLAAEVRSHQLDVVAQPLPEHALGVGRSGAHAAREFALTIVHCQ